MKRLGFISAVVLSIGFTTIETAIADCPTFSVSKLYAVMQKTYSNIKVLGVTCSATGSTVYISTKDGLMQIQCTPTVSSDYSPTDLTVGDNYCAGSTLSSKYIPLKQ